MNTANTILGNWLPTLLLGASALAATNAAMLIHSNHMNLGQQCLPCLCFCFLYMAIAFCFGPFLMFLCLENTTEESGGLLREIEDEIRVRTNRGSCSYGRHVIRRGSLPARLFRRRIIRWKMGQFKNVEPGSAVQFLLQTADNVITYAFMVNVGTDMWLV